MKEIKLIKENEITVKREFSIYCDFCGSNNVEVFTSSCTESNCECKNETQVCVDCVKQLSKYIKND